ncbi:uncharacterized protein V6R79_015762 [Siganus canaliculatus]
MAAFTGRALHQQLSVIMDALTKAALAEICEVVDEGYALLQMEISRSQKENEDLKKKLHLIQSIVLRGSSGGMAAELEVAAAEESGTPRAETLPLQRQQQQRQRDVDGADTAADPAGDGGAGVTVVEEELPDVVLIKDEDSDDGETYDEDSKAAADGGAVTTRDAVTSVAVGTKRRWRESEADVRKPASEQLKGSKMAAGVLQKKDVALYALDSAGGDLEPGEVLCAYATDVQLLQQDCSLAPPSAGRQAAFFPNNASSLLESPTNPTELDLSLTWTKQVKGHGTFPQFQPSDDADGDAFGIKLVSVSGSAPTDSQLSESSSSAFEYDGSEVMNFAPYREAPPRPQPSGRGKRFFCSICSRRYATSQNLEVHMRIHTGERPFCCQHCGKKFTQSAHLKSHLSVHTGERPHVCSVCCKSFIVKYSLKLHMKKSHPRVPYD